MFGSKVRIPKELLERCKRHAEAVGYGSVEEFIVHTLEKATRQSTQGTDSKDNEAITKRLQGLGYLA